MRTSARTLLTVFAAAAVFAACADQPTGPAPEALGSALDANASLVASASGGGNWDLVADFTGDGLDDVVGSVIGFNAKRYADGTVKGQIQYQQSFEESETGDVTTFHYHADVTCISVYDGNRAKFGGPLTRSDDPGVPVGVYIWHTVIDNGEGAGADPDIAVIFGLGDNAANEAFCASPALPPAIFQTPLTSGNVKVSG